MKKRLMRRKMTARRSRLVLSVNSIQYENVIDLYRELKKNHNAVIEAAIRNVIDDIMMPR